MSHIRIIQADITRLAVDAIVNAANESLLGGGGVDGAIHRAAGPELLAECRTLNGCPTGEAKITRAYGLPAKHVIHTVGPVWQGGQNNEDDLLASCYRNSLILAADNGLKSIAFPAISTAIYGFPLKRATAIALREMDAFLSHGNTRMKVIAVCYSRGDYQVYKETAQELGIMASTQIDF